MSILSKKNYRLFFLIIFLFILILFFYFYVNKFQKKILNLEPISINLLTSVHPNLSWSFKPVQPKINVKPVDVTTFEYIIENLGSVESTGIATFSYFPDQLGDYISKINCFCYDAQTLQSEQKGKFTLVLLIDPEVTKDSKTKDVK